LAKREKVSGQKAASANVVVAEAAPTTSTVRCKSLVVASAHPKIVASAPASVSKVNVNAASPRARVLKINVRMRRPSAAPSPAAKGKQARLDVGPVLTSNAAPKICAQLWVSMELDEGRVAYCALLDSIPPESSSSSSAETSGSELIFPHPSLMQDLHVSVKVLRLWWLAREFLPRLVLTWLWLKVYYFSLYELRTSLTFDINLMLRFLGARDIVGTGAGFY
jgi:hypothetical protein